ncbi:PREDICTED: uncharacterized protein LOC106547016 [Thamnophis sirtalis]|uniref:Uncharacterized protein LOC106547016 n=1 Tax=Thamnophis sirtalis TaxID=35019 RepID=A0A6I9Y553_9SAUR|nr:PREDICTED: uncharacterized protein LOC106547016 [Thamnophis sirtalis]
MTVRVEGRRSEYHQLPSGSYQDLVTCVGQRDCPPESWWAYSFSETYFNYINWSFPPNSVQLVLYRSITTFHGPIQSHKTPDFQVHCDDDLSDNTKTSGLGHCPCFHVRVTAGHATGLLRKQAGCSCIILSWESQVFPPKGPLNPPTVSKEGGSPSLIQGFLLYPDGGIGLWSPVFTTQHIFTELGGIYASPAGRCHIEPLLEQPFKNLYRIQPAVAVQREADDMGGVLVPAGIHRVAHHISRLWKDLLDQRLLPTQGDPLTEIRRHPHHQAVTGLEMFLLLFLLLPSLQFLDHRLQLVILGFFIQKTEVLKILREQQL